MSPREPTTMITMDMGGAGSASVGGPGAASTSLACAVSQEGAWAKQRAAWSKSILSAPPAPAETAATPRTAAARRRRLWSRRRRNAAAKASTKPSFSGSATSWSFQALSRGRSSLIRRGRSGQEGKSSGAAGRDPSIDPRGRGARAILTFSIMVDIACPPQHGEAARIVRRSCPSPGGQSSGRPANANLASSPPPTGKLSGPALQLRGHGCEADPDPVRCPVERLHHLAVDLASRIAQRCHTNLDLEIAQDDGTQVRCQLALLRRERRQPAVVHGSAGKFLLQHRESDAEWCGERRQEHCSQRQRELEGLANCSHLEQGEAPRDALRLDLTLPVDAQRGLDPVARILGDEHLTADGEGLDAPGQVHGGSHRGVLGTVQ